MNSKRLERKTEKHEIEMLNRGGGLKADENWISAKNVDDRMISGGYFYRL